MIDDVDAGDAIASTKHDGQRADEVWTIEGHLDCVGSACPPVGLTAALTKQECEKLDSGARVACTPWRILTHAWPLQRRPPRQDRSISRLASIAMPFCSLFQDRSDVIVQHRSHRTHLFRGRTLAHRQNGLPCTTPVSMSLSTSTSILIPISGLPTSNDIQRRIPSACLVCAYQSTLDQTTLPRRCNRRPNTTDFTTQPAGAIPISEIPSNNLKISPIVNSLRRVPDEETCGDMTGVHASAALPETMSAQVRTAIPIEQRQNPRRTAAVPKSTQLSPGNKRRKLSHSPDRAEVASAPTGQIRSQGSSSDQSANHWFDRVNEHPTQVKRSSNGEDDEPPFFMSHQKSYRPNNFESSDGSKAFGGQSRIDSENEDLRGVIDDLTVENKRLKQILRTNQRSQRNSPSTEGQDKMFEVRMHGLRPEKRRELEFLLKNFATSVHTSVHSLPNSTAGSGVSSNSLAANNHGKAKTDSGYASNSNSGQPSLMHTQQRAIPRISESTRDKNIKSYLHDIPDILMPRQQPVVMSERAKMASVVRRLEQLFTGRKAAPGEHSQPLQQQEVSQLAARADAKNSRKRKSEGSREARILPPDSKVNFDAIDVPEEGKKPKVKSSESDLSTPEETSGAVSRPGSPDQRPTRPLDLDIHRAQVAAENLEYLHHLGGLASPSLDSTDSKHPWMFLNLLINMAQIHTINVTPEFVRRSIRKLSSKFELSKDGHRVRWVGGPEGTVFSKEEEKALEIADSSKESNGLEDHNDDPGTSGSSKRSKTDSNSNAMVSNTTSDDKTSGQQTSSASRQQVSTGATSVLPASLPSRQTQSGSAFDYKPIVYRERPSGLQAEEAYLLDSESSPGTSSRDSSGLAHALSRSNLNQQRHADEGLITFYNNAFFCSDYSGDKMPSNMRPARDSVPGLTLGIDPGNEWDIETSRLAHACYFTSRFGPAPFDYTPDEDVPDLNVVPLSSYAGEEETRPLELPVSGLGGMVPDDNFAVDVEIHMNVLPANARVKPISRIPLTGTEVKPSLAYSLGKSDKIDLLPARLPPASYIFFASSSSSGNLVDEDDDESFDDSDETSSIDEDHPAPPTFLQHWSAEDSGDVDSVYNDGEDDSSVDFLATARAADPVRIAEQERQYMINQPGGRAVAGSLAATVGASRSSSSASGAEEDVDDEDFDVDSDKPEAGSEADDDDSGMDMDY